MSLKPEDPLKVPPDRPNSQQSPLVTRFVARCLVLTYAQPFQPAVRPAPGPSRPTNRSREAGVPVQRGRGGVEMVVCKLNHRANSAGGLFV